MCGRGEPIHGGAAFGPFGKTILGHGSEGGGGSSDDDRDCGRIFGGGDRGCGGAYAAAAGGGGGMSGGGGVPGLGADAFDDVEGCCSIGRVGNDTVADADSSIATALLNHLSNIGAPSAVRNSLLRAICCTVMKIKCSRRKPSWCSIIMCRLSR